MKGWEAKAILDPHGLWIEREYDGHYVYRYQFGELHERTVVTGPHETLDEALKAAMRIVVEASQS